MQWTPSSAQILSNPRVVALALPGIFALAFEPARWLVETWRAPAYGSDGAWIALGTAILILASVSSGPALAAPRERRSAWILLGVTAAVRLVGQVLAVNTIGALALAVDVAAISMLLGVSRRRFAVSPWALAGLFALSLPLEHHGQRLLGHPLQLIAAQVSHIALLPFFPDVTREGVLLIHPATALAVDLPCSGARGLSVYATVAVALWSCHRLKASSSLGLCIAVAGGALLANAARIIALFIGTVHEIPVADEPWHGALGAAALALGAIPMLAVFRRAPRRMALPAVGGPLSIAIERTAPELSWGAALAISIVGIAIASAPPHPIDAIPIARDRFLPSTLGDFDGDRVPLAPAEARFFSQWGGSADKRQYQNETGTLHTALWVRTRAPLRHLHGPDLCLIGSGHQVTRMGVVPGDVPTVLYKSIAPDGSAWRVQASFASDRGEVASSVSEVVWHWLAQPDDAWNLVERISPWDLCENFPEQCGAFDSALFTSLDLPTTEQRFATNVLHPQKGPSR